MLLVPITATIALYSAAWFVLLRAIRQGQAGFPLVTKSLVTLGLVSHISSVYQATVLPAGFHIDFFTALSVLCWTSVLIVALSSLRKPLQNLLIIILPLAITALLLELFLATPTVGNIIQLDPGVATHIFLSILGYSTMIVATFQATLLAIQDHKIRHKHPTGWIRLLPPLQTMEALLFAILWVGQVLLTLVIVTGFFRIQDIGEQHLHHKIVFTVIAWVIYAVLLWGRHAMGWRGVSAIKWTLSGFAFLLLAYLGSKFVLELVLEKSV